MKKKERSRKWMLAMWGAAISITTIVAGLASHFLEIEGAGNLITQGFSGFGAVLLLYEGANVSQHYVDRNSGGDEKVEK